MSGFDRKGVFMSYCLENSSTNTSQDSIFSYFLNFVFSFWVIGGHIEGHEHIIQESAFSTLSKIEGNF